MTVGTDDKTALKIHGVKLLSSHDYAVIGRRIICLTTLHCLIRNRNQRIQRRALGHFTRLSCVCSLSSECLADTTSVYASEYLFFWLILFWRFMVGRGS